MTGRHGIDGDLLEPDEDDDVRDDDPWTPSAAAVPAPGTDPHRCPHGAPRAVDGTACVRCADLSAGRWARAPRHLRKLVDAARTRHRTDHEHDVDAPDPDR